MNEKFTVRIHTALLLYFVQFSENRFSRPKVKKKKNTRKSKLVFIIFYFDIKRIWWSHKSLVLWLFGNSTTFIIFCCCPCYAARLALYVKHILFIRKTKLFNNLILVNWRGFFFVGAPPRQIQRVWFHNIIICRYIIMCGYVSNKHKTRKRIKYFILSLI